MEESYRKINFLSIQRESSNRQSCSLEAKGAASKVPRCWWAGGLESSGEIEDRSGGFLYMITLRFLSSLAFLMLGEMASVSPKGI